MSDDDGLYTFSWPEYTEEDFQEIDRLCEGGRQNGVTPNHGAPNILIELEGAADRIIKLGEGSQEVDKSPYALFRAKRGYLSVSDIVSPAWCEVQFDYGLRQLRKKPLAERPKSFITEKGKEIHVKTEIAVKNEEVLDKGRTIHKKLEREIHKEEVPILVKTKEESWALRLLDKTEVKQEYLCLRMFIVLSIYTELKNGISQREVPVWGIIHEHAIFGIIDELRFESDFGEPDEAIPGKRHTQTNLDSFITADARKFTHETKTITRSILHIVDNKTRHSPHLPQHADTLPSRLQLMLYWLMLSQALTNSNNALSYSTYCTRIGLKPSRAFSKTFIAEMSALVVENELSLHFLDAKCLEDMDFPYRETIKDMGLDVEGCVSKRLSLVYRLRSRPAKKLKITTTTARVKNSAGPQNQLPTSVSVEEVVESDVSVDESDIKLVTPVGGTVEVADSMSRKGTDRDEPSAKEAPLTTEVDKGNVNPSSTRKRKRRESRVSSTSTAKSSAETLGDSSIDESDSSSDVSDSSPAASPSPFILGTKKFQYDDALLNVHLLSVLAWWHGKRPARGVSIEDAGRCYTCEYKTGCEWREQKALELLERAHAKAAPQQNARTS